jgi:hypothetical protein
MGPPVPHEPIPPKPDEVPARPRVPADIRRRYQLAQQREAEETAAHMVRVIAADPVKIAWLRDYGARLLEAAAAEIRQHQAVAEGVDGALVVERRAREHRAGGTALW